MGNAAYSNARIRKGKVAPAEIIDEDIDDTEDEEVYYADEAPTSRGRALALGGSVVVLVAILSVIVWLLSNRPPSGTGGAGLNPPAPAVGYFAPSFNMRDVHTNNNVTLASLKGKPVVINFWGTWCPPCRGEMPLLEQIYQKYGKEVEMYGISMAPKDTPEMVKTFVDGNKYDWKFIHDADQSVMANYIVTAVPSTYFIDKDGVIRAIKVGAFPNIAEIESDIQIIK